MTDRAPSERHFELLATVIRADGSREELGVVATTHPDEEQGQIMIHTTMKEARNG